MVVSVTEPTAKLGSPVMPGIYMHLELKYKPSVILT